MDDPNLFIPQPTVMPPGNGAESAHGPADASPDERPSGALTPAPQESEAAGASIPETQSGRTESSPAEPVAAETMASPEKDLVDSSPQEGGDAVAESSRETSPGEQLPSPEAVLPEQEPKVETPAAELAAQVPPRKPVQVPPPTEQPVSEVPKSEKMDWYILKVQSNREESIREGLRRKIKIAGLDPYFGDIIIPTEKVTEFKAGKRKVFKRKLYPGYLVVQMEITEDTWFLVRETPGIGDFTGAAGHPTPMQAREVAAIRAKQEEKADEAPKLKIAFRIGDHVKIKEGTFENFEGEVATIDETNGRVTVLINIFGRSTPVDIEYWQIEAV